MKTCLICGAVFESHSQYANHIKWKHNNTDETKKKISAATSERYAKINGPKIEKTKMCCTCGKSFDIIEPELKTKDRYFCSRSCANTRIHSDTTKQKMSKSTLIAIAEGRLIPDHHINNKCFSSKNERLIVNHFKSVFTADEWTSGGLLKYNNLRISRDLYSNKLKICIEYDGIWHFKDITGQLKQKQEKDAALEQWCILNNYRLIRISENVFTADKSKWMNILINEVYNGTEQIVKFY